MVLRAAALVALLVFAGCVTPPGDEQRESWQLDVPPRSQIGQSASFDLAGSPWSLQGHAFVRGLDAPWTFVVEERFEGSWLFFPDARFGGEAPVLLVLKGDRFTFDEGRAGGFDALAVRSDGVALSIEPRDDLRGMGARTYEVPDAIDGAEDAYRAGQQVSGPVQDVRVDGYQDAWTVKDGQATPLGSVDVFSAPGWIWARGSAIETRDALSLDATRFALGGDLRGTVDAEDGDVRDPEGVFGNDADIDVTPTSLSAGPFRLTQTLSDAGLSMDADIQVDPVEDLVVARAGKTDWVAVNYRERSYYGDAVIEDIVIEGPGAHMVRVPTAPGTFIQELWEWAVQASKEAPWGAPFFAIPVIIASPFVLITEIANCIFSECPEGHPYPVWMDAASVGVFYVKVQPPEDQEAGDYPVTVRLEGQNHATETFSFTIEVPPT